MEITGKTFEEDGERRELIITLTASAKEVDAAVKEYFKELAKNPIPGFRKGKAPRNVLEHGVGGHTAAYGGVAEKLINTHAFKALDDGDVLFVGQPEFNVAEIPEDGKEFSFTVSGVVPPAMELSEYGPVSIEMPPDEATDAEIDEHIDNLRDYYHTFKNIDNPKHEAAMGDYVNMTVTCTKAADGLAIRGLTEVQRLVGLGAGTMPESFDEHILGAKVGDKLEFDFDAGQNDAKPELGDGKLHAEVEVEGFRECIVPELNDEFAQKLGSQTVEELRGAVKMALNANKRKELPALMVDRCVAALIERLQEPVPEYFVNVLREDVGREFMQSLEKNGTNLQDYILNNNVKREEIKQQISDEALHRAKCDVAIEAVFAHEGMEVTDEEIEKTLAQEEDAAAARKTWEDANRMADLRKLVRQDMVTRWLVKTAQVTVIE